jgi:hypothetical protein
MGSDWTAVTMEDLVARFGVDRYAAGDWFLVPHEFVLKVDGYPFAEKEGPGDGRRVLLASKHGPNAVIYPRSASGESGVEHAKHVHVDGGGNCKLNLQGWVVFQTRVLVDGDCLNDETHSCQEPDGSSLWQAIHKARRI